MSKTPQIYLAGPITGCNYHHAVKWRTYVTDQLSSYNVECRSPLRNLEHLGQLEIMPALPELEGEKHPMRTSKAVTTRDRFDLMSADLVFVNFLGTERASIGTLIELGWADILRKPVIVVMEPNNIHDHAMVRELSGFVVLVGDDGDFGAALPAFEEQSISLLSVSFSEMRFSVIIFVILIVSDILVDGSVAVVAWTAGKLVSTVADGITPS